jgi:hypothetical protein
MAWLLEPILGRLGQDWATQRAGFLQRLSGEVLVMAEDLEPGDVLDESPVESEEAESSGEYKQTGSLGTGTQGDSIARELAERERRSDS